MYVYECGYSKRSLELCLRDKKRMEKRSSGSDLLTCLYVAMLNSLENLTRSRLRASLLRYFEAEKFIESYNI